MRRSVPLFVALLTAVVVPLIAQTPRATGRVVDLTSAYVTTDHGDQRIVSTVLVDLRGTTVAVDVEGGTVDGVTMTTSEAQVPARGAVVTLILTGPGAASGRGRWRLAPTEDAFLARVPWRHGLFEYVLDTLHGELPPAVIERDVFAAAQDWPVQSGAALTTRYLGRLPDGSGVQARDGRNQVMFRPGYYPSNSSALAVAYWWSSGGYLVDADIIGWSGKVNWVASDAPCPGTTNGTAYLEDIMVHEFGHALGLGHSTVSGATMRPRYSKCSSALRSLASDDIAGILSLYGVRR